MIFRWMRSLTFFSQMMCWNIWMKVRRCSSFTCIHTWQIWSPNILGCLLSIDEGCSGLLGVDIMGSKPLQPYPPFLIVLLHVLDQVDHCEHHGHQREHTADVSDHPDRHHLRHS